MISQDPRSQKTAPRRPDDTAGLVVSWLLGAVVRQDVTDGMKQQPGRRELQRLIEAAYS